MAVLEAATDIWAKLGNLGKVLIDALADGRIEARGGAVKRAAFPRFQPVMQSVARVDGMTDKAVK